MVSTVQEATFKFPVVSFRRIPSPADPQNYRNYIAVASVFDLPDLSNWRRINVRDPKETGSVPKAIKETLEDNPGMFFFMNRGMVLTAKKVEFNTESGELSITLSNPDIHGLLDGGHTYKVLKTYSSSTDRDSLTPDQ